MASAESKYSLVSDSESENSENAAFIPHPYKTTQRRSRGVWILHAILLLTSTALFVASFFRYQGQSKSLPSIEPEYTREYKPIVDAVGQQHSWQYLGAFDQPSKYRGQPNADVDAAWDEVTISGVFNVPEEEIAKIGKLTNSTVRLPEESGGQYMASIEAVHQLHCLDMMRKFSYREYYADKSEHFAHPGKFRIHLDHCTELIRQSIMCNTDLHIVTYNWVDHVDYPWPDFSINRQCRNYDDMLEWVSARKATVHAKDGLIKRPEGHPTKHVRPVDYVHEHFSDEDHKIG